MSTCRAASGYAVVMVFWTIPPVFLEARGAAMGIGMISALGQFGGLSGPAVVGWAFQETGSIYIGFAIAAVTILLGTLLAVFAIPHPGCASRRGSCRSVRISSSRGGRYSRNGFRRPSEPAHRGGEARGAAA
jgi:hypothetical protein